MPEHTQQQHLSPIEQAVLDAITVEAERDQNTDVPSLVVNTRLSEREVYVALNGLTMLGLVEQVDSDTYTLAEALPGDQPRDAQPHDLALSAGAAVVPITNYRPMMQREAERLTSGSTVQALNADGVLCQGRVLSFSDSAINVRLTLPEPEIGDVDVSFETHNGDVEPLPPEFALLDSLCAWMLVEHIDEPAVTGPALTDEERTALAYLARFGTSVGDTMYDRAFAALVVRGLVTKSPHGLYVVTSEGIALNERVGR